MSFKLHKLLRTVMSAATLATLFAVAMPAAHAGTVTIYNNLGSSQDYADPVYAFGPLASSFRTGAGGGALAGIQALLHSVSADVAGDIQVSLHADSGNALGALLLSLGSLSAADVSTDGFEVYSFAPGSDFMLAANTTYWVELMASDPIGIEWSVSGDTSALGVAGQFNYSNEYKVTSNDAFGSYQMSVSLVPEPASLALVFLGLGLTVVVSRRRRG